MTPQTNPQLPAIPQAVGDFIKRTKVRLPLRGTVRPK
jgi:hypothetical protein